MNEAETIVVVNEDYVELPKEMQDELSNGKGDDKDEQ